MNDYDNLSRNAVGEKVVKAAPHPIAEIANLPLSIASYMLRQGWFPDRDKDGYILKDDVLLIAYRYREMLDVPAIFEPLGRSLNGVPTLPAWEDDEGYLKVYCRWCRTFHNHGRGEGGRMAHCEWDSPYRRPGSAGYDLKVMGKWSQEIKTQAPPTAFPRMSPNGE